MSQNDTKRSTTTSSILSYTIGFAASVGLTLLAFFAVQQYTNTEYSSYSSNSIILLIMALATIQLAVQLAFFLHLGSENKPRLNLMSFTFMLTVVGIVVIGSLWIMNHLDYHHMTPKDVDTHMYKEKDKGF